jgi:hypothetical protein
MAKTTNNTTDNNKCGSPVTRNGSKKTITTKTTSSTGAASGAIDDANNNDNSDKKQLRIAVGTTNPCKIDAVKKALEKAIGLSTDNTTPTSNQVELHVEGFSVESGVPDQPFGDVR